MTNDSRTFVSHESWRASEIGGAGSLVRVETVHADGRVEWSVEGNTDDDGRISKRGVRRVDPVVLGADGLVDLERVTAARLVSGWRVR